jgi:CheY-like chemotaxis protein
VVAETSSASSALEAVERHAPHAVLLDVRLGDDDGFIVRGAQARPLRPRGPTASDTGSDSDSDSLDYAEQVAGAGRGGGAEWWASHTSPTPTSGSSRRGAESGLDPMDRRLFGV